MKRYIGNENSSPAEILELLQHNADDVEKLTYVKEFNAEELKDHMKDYIAKSVEYSKLEDEKKAVVKVLTEKMKPLHLEVKTLMYEVKNEGETIENGEVFVFVDQEERSVNYVSPEGFLISSRPAKQSELRQPGIFNMTRKAMDETPTPDISSEKTGTDDLTFAPDHE